MSNPSTSSLSSAAPPSPFSLLPGDIIVNILAKLEADPRDWARLSCVSAPFAALVRGCCRSRCARALPSAAADLLPSTASPAALYKFSVCCPGLVRAGVLLEHSDLGLERDIGPDLSVLPHDFNPPAAAAVATAADPCPPPPPPPPTAESASSQPSWSLFDDLYLDTVYDPSESSQNPTFPPPDSDSAAKNPILIPGEPSRKRRRQRIGPVGAHLASGSWTLSREQGNRLLASRFRGDCLYICEWPGCVHVEEKRSYMLFRGVFKDFKRSSVWRTISNSNRGKTGPDCAFCACQETWDLHSAFCLKRVFGFYDDGEPVVRAYVCENGHVAGAWTERPKNA